MQQIIKPIIIVLIGAIIAAPILLLSNGIWNPSWNPFKPVVGDILIDALTKSFAAKTFAFNASLGVDSQANISALTGNQDDQAKNVKIALIIKEEIDKADIKNIKASAQIDLGAEIEGITISGKLEALGFGETTYLKLVSFPSFLPLPFDIEGLKGKWIKLNMKELQKKFGASGLQLPTSDSSELQDTLADLQGIVANKKIFVVKRTWGKEDIADGVLALHYTLGLSKKGIKELALAYFQLVKKYLPPEKYKEAEKQLTDFQQDFDKNFERYWRTLSEIRLDIWIESSSGRLVKLKWEEEIDPAKVKKAINQDVKSMKLQLDLTLSRFNEEFKFQEPTDFQEAEGIIKDLFGQLAPATSSTSTLP